MIAGDFSIHVDYSADVHSDKLSDVLYSYCFQLQQSTSTSKLYSSTTPVQVQVPGTTFLAMSCRRLMSMTAHWA